MRITRLSLVLVILLCTSAAAVPHHKRPGVVYRDGSALLANGDRIHPRGGVRIRLNGDLPLAFAPSANPERCYVVTGGFHDHGITAINLTTETNDFFIPSTKCTGGIVETKDGEGYFAAGDLGIRKFMLSSDKDPWSPLNSTLPAQAWIQSVAPLPDGTLVASDINNDQLLCLDPATLASKWQLKVGHKPSRLAVDPERKVIAVANWGGASVSLASFDGASAQQVAVGIHPSELLFGQDGSLYVSNAGSNSVSVVRDGAVVATFFTSISAQDLVGSTPCGLALTPDQHTLFVANAGNNNVAQIDVSDPAQPKVEGFIPTGWYPTALFVAPDGKRLLVATGKGFITGPNYPGVEPQQTITDDLKTRYDYLPSRLEGDVTVVSLPTAAQLAASTATCRRLARREMSRRMQRLEAGMLPTLHKIKHVVYVIRENRTFDQVLGDLPGVNAEPRLCMYGEKVTPNGHALARGFKVFDNLYCDGEVSQDGHQWCCSAYCTDFTEKVWPSNYAGRGHPDDDDSVTSSPGGYLWDNCRKHGLSYRSYGEFASFASNKGSAPTFHGKAGLEGHTSEAWALDGRRDYQRVDTFIDELHQAEQDGNWPNFMVMSLGEDHTEGLTPGAYTPFAKVASNDLGLGKLVEAVSHSKFWKSTAIFVIEDDGQNGPDHVDGHRTVGYVISPYIRRGGADHTLYSTASMVRTMELILGLPPMSQHDRHATSMVASFTSKPDLKPFTHLEARIDLDAKNPLTGPLAEASLKLDFSHYDLADPDALNHILWADAKPGVPYPVISHLSK
jgi:DNA-binding beta-propeller fold protein YncE